MFDMEKLLPVCNIFVSPTFFHVITGRGHPVAAHMRSIESVSFNTIDVLGLLTIFGFSVIKTDKVK